MAMKLRDVGKLPYTKIVPFNDKKWHNTQGATFPRYEGGGEKGRGRWTEGGAMR